MHDLATIQSMNAAAVKEHEEIDTMSDLEKYIARQIKERPIEARLVRRIYRAMAKAGMPIVRVSDRESSTDTPTLNDVLNEVFNLDECWLFTADESWIYLVMGQEYETLTDYTTNLEDALKPVSDWIDRWDN